MSIQNYLEQAVAAKNNNGLIARLVFQNGRSGYDDARFYQLIDNGVFTDDENDVDIYLTVADARRIALQIDELDARTIAVNAFLPKDGYRRVLDNPAWQALYNTADRNLPRCAANSTVTTYVAMQTIPCTVCGFCFPPKHIEIDHQQPQEGGEWLAVIKVLRSLGMTLDPPKGMKGLTLLHGQAFGGANVKAPIGTFRAAVRNYTIGGPPPPNRGARRRYTTTGAGNAFVSLVCSVQGGMDALLNACMHSFVNLKPLCGPCNGSKSNRLKYDF